MTELRQRMLEELPRRNFASTTIGRGLSHRLPTRELPCLRDLHGTLAPVFSRTPLLQTHSLRLPGARASGSLLTTLSKAPRPAVRPHAWASFDRGTSDKDPALSAHGISIATAKTSVRARRGQLRAARWCRMASDRPTGAIA